MSRRKTGYTPENPWKNIWISVFGERYSRRVWGLAPFWRQYFEMRDSAAAMKEYGFTRAMLKSRYEDLCKETSEAIREAITTKDGSFLRQMAAFYEEIEVADTQRQWLLAMHYNWTERPLRQKKEYTSKELCDLAAKRIKWIVTPRYIEKVCKQMGIKLRKGEEGRPRKTRNRLKS